MAIIKSHEFDGYSGKLGNIIFRTRYGKTVAYRVTENFKKSESEASKANREKWKVMAQFASNICSLPELKQIWELDEETKATSTYHKIEKSNRKIKTTYHPVVDNIIVPIGYKCETNIIKLNKDELNINVSLVKGSLADITKADNFLVIAIICFYDPVNKEDEKFTFYNIYKQITKWKPETPVNAEYKFSEEEGKIFSEYKKSILYYTVIACDAEGYYISHSVSYSLKLDNKTGLELKAKQGEKI